MPDQIYIGNIPKGQVNIREAFNIDNSAFQLLYNFFVWRGRVRRKLGTIPLGRATIQIELASVPNNWQLPALSLTAGSVNLLAQFSNPQSSIVPGTINISVNSQSYTDINKDGTLTGGAGGEINYSSGIITITGATNESVIGDFSYFPSTPILGIEDFLSSDPFIKYPLNIFFDQTNAYQFNGVNMFNVSFYKKTNNPISWHGENYQQFWSTNYQSAFWASNNVPGMQFQNIKSIAWVTAQQLTIVITDSPAIVGDYLWLNEITTNATTDETNKLDSINHQTGIVAVVSGTRPGDITLTVNFPNSTILDPSVGDSGKVYQAGIAQYLTNSITEGGDGIRWYDGDPTNNNGYPPVSPTGFGWVNFAPPLTGITDPTGGVPINQFPQKIYYLVGALIITPFKDRLLFFGCWIQASTGPAIYLQDTAFWSWNGTAYYNDLTPTDSQVSSVHETNDPSAYYVDQTGKGGYLSAGTSANIATLTNNEDVLLVGFTNRQTRFVYTGNDINPFLFFNINSELNSSATFSGVTLDQGGITIGSYGIAKTDQQSSQRIDLDIPNEVFNIQNSNNGAERVNAVRDYYNEWIYFSYPVKAQTTTPVSGQINWIFPTQTFIYNYRDDTWGILYENYTAHGTYRAILGQTWTTIGNKYPTWSVWNDPWNSPTSATLFPQIVAGNPQGYVVIKDDSTNECPSGSIQAISNDNGSTQITSVNSCVSPGDYLLFSGALGMLTSTITAITKANPCVITTTNTFDLNSYVTINNVIGMTELNGNTYQIIEQTGSTITLNVNSTSFTTYVSDGTVQSAFNGQIGKVITVSTDRTMFTVDLPFPSGTYLGLGEFTRLSQPQLLTKQFNSYWEQGRQIRLSKQQYLFESTEQGEVTVRIYLSQDNVDPWNDPETDSAETPNGLIYSQLVYTCAESTNLGLTPSNVTLQSLLPIGSQKQIWHRMNTGLIGDTVQIGITLSDSQMRNTVIAQSEIDLHAINLTISPSSLLS